MGGHIRIEKEKVREEVEENEKRKKGLGFRV